MARRAARARAQADRAAADPPARRLATAGRARQRHRSRLAPRQDDARLHPGLLGSGGGDRGPDHRRLDSEEGRALYRKRQRIIEPIFGQTKANRGIDRFLCRGLGACRAEWSLITATHNC
ncbi:MAG: transposase [Thermoleophilaceae bacterium]